MNRPNPRAIVVQVIKPSWPNMFSSLCRPIEPLPHAGGFRQREARPVVPDHVPSRAALGHLLDWGDGATSARQLVRHLSNIIADGETRHPMIRRIVEAGTGGGGGGVAAEALNGLMLNRCGFANLITEVQGAAVTNLCLPSTMLQCIFDKYPRKYHQLMVSSPMPLDQFWDTMRKDASFDAYVKAHPVLSRFGRNSWRTLVPVTVFEDSGPYTKNKGCNVLSWGSFLGSGGEKVSQFIMGSYIKEGRLSQDQIDKMWAPILADFEHLLTHPVGGYCFTLLYAKGDLEVRSNSWGLPHYGSFEICTECRADTGTRPYTDLGSQAAWRSCLIGNAAQFLERVRRPLHPLVASSFFWRGFMPLDVMHVADCKGAANIIAGSVIRPIILECVPIGATQELRMDAINTRLDEFYAGRPGHNRMPHLRLTNLVSDGWSCLAGPIVKAANTRALAPFLVVLADEFYADIDDEFALMVSRAARGLNRMYEIMYAAGVFLSDSEVAELRRVLARLGATVMILREMSRGRGILAWNVTPKMHMLQHLGSFPAKVNPRWLQNYMEESSVGTTTKVWSRSASGRYRRTVQKMVFLKRLVTLMIRLETDGYV